MILDMFTLPDLRYDYKALEPYIDEETMHIHHDKHHAGYIKNLNEALEKYPNLQKMEARELLEHLNEVPEEIRTKVRNNAGGHVNHTLFWEIMTPNPKEKEPMPEAELYEQINKDFGSFGDFKLGFTNAAMGRFGSGWAWLVKSNGKLEIADTPNQDTPVMDGKLPILGLDVWEHAYYLKYKNMRADYIKAWWNVVNWEQVSENFASV